MKTVYKAQRRKKGCEGRQRANKKQQNHGARMGQQSLKKKNKTDARRFGGNDGGHHEREKD